MSDMTLNTCAFHDFKCIGEGSIGIDVDKVLEVIKAAKKGDSIGISITEDKIIMSAGIIVREIKPIDTTGFSDPKVPNLNLPGQFTINQEYLVTALEQCGNVSDHVAIEGDIQGNLKIYSSGDTDGVKATIPKDFMANVRMNEAFKSLFPLDYLQTIAKASQFGMLLKGQELNICMGNDYPIKIEAGTKDWEITYLLAPRMESE
jgi:DNA polymerase III sliding clamp (beta) subunit (PCNA family)